MVDLHFPLKIKLFGGYTQFLDKPIFYTPNMYIYIYTIIYV